MEGEETGRDVGSFLDQYLPELAAEPREKLNKLAALHERYRERARLSSALSAEAYVVHLVLDSLKLAELAPPAGGEAVADVGSGGGYPGLPLAIIREDLAVTLIEPAPRKAEYLRLAAEELALANVAVEGRPAQELPSESFDLACSKALAGSEIALKLMLPLVRRGGRAVLFRGDFSEGALASL
ncbi:MAG: class I SAM-dependent methyltransferase, partial [Candidatus Coatesbacteria bacterium]